MTVGGTDVAIGATATVPPTATIRGLTPARLRTVVIATVAVTVGLGALAAWARLAEVEFGGSAELVTLFNLDSEYNVPTIVSVLGLASCAGLLAVVAAVARARGSVDARRFGWLGAIFVLLAVDEGARLHERLNEPMSALGLTSGAFRFGWVIVGGLLVVALVPLYLPLVLRLEPPIRTAFLLAAAAYVGGALGFEMVGARVFDPDATSYILVTVVEELLELAGIGLFLVALHRLLTSWAPTLVVRSAPETARLPRR